MARTAAEAPKVEFNATLAQKKQGIPRFVTVETGEYEMDADGEVVLDPETGEPTPKTKVLIIQRTGKALLKVIEMSPDDEDEETPDEDPDKPKAPEKPTGEDAKDTVNFTYEALAQFLCDPSDGMKPVDPVWLAGVLDFSVAREWLNVLMPTGGAEGNSENETPSTKDLSATS